MNIQDKLFKIYNTVKYGFENWNERSTDDGESAAKAIYYAGAYNTAKLFLKTYQGEFSEADIDFWLKKLDNPMNEAGN
jgi:hypothetical protein